MKRIVLIFILFTNFYCNSQNIEVKKIKLHFLPSFHPESELQLNCKKLSGVFELIDVPIVKEKFIIKEKVKRKFKLEPIDLNYIYERVNLIYKELKESKNLTTENNQLQIQDIYEDGMTILIELKLKDNEKIIFEVGNSFNKLQKKLLIEIIDLLKDKIPTEMKYLNELVEYF